MTVYIINNMTVHDQEEYRKYVKDFMPVFERFGGKILAVQNAPSAVEGTWPFDRTVLLSFPTREAALQWANSPGYKGIAVHRQAGTTSNVVILDGLPPMPAPAAEPSPARFPGKNVVHCTSVELQPGSVSLVLDCEEQDGPDLVEGLNLVGDRLEVLVDEEHGQER